MIEPLYADFPNHNTIHALLLEIDPQVVIAKEKTSIGSPPDEECLIVLRVHTFNDQVGITQIAGTVRVAVEPCGDDDDAQEAVMSLRVDLWRCDAPSPYDCPHYNRLEATATRVKSGLEVLRRIYRLVRARVVESIGAGRQWRTITAHPIANLIAFSPSLSGAITSLLKDDSGRARGNIERPSHDYTAPLRLKVWVSDRELDELIVKLAFVVSDLCKKQDLALVGERGAVWSVSPPPIDDPTPPQAQGSPGEGHTPPA